MPQFHGRSAVGRLSAAWPLVVMLASLAPCQGAQPLGAKQEQQWRKQIRENFFVPDPLPPLNARTHRRFQPAPGVKAEAVTYATEFGLRVPAILYLPDPLPKTASGKIPGFPLSSLNCNL